MKSSIALATILLATAGLVNVAVAAVLDPGVTIEPGRAALLF